MVDRVRLLDHVESRLSESLRPFLAVSVRQLREWTGEFASSVSGAAPPSGPPPDRGDDDEAGAVLSKVEQDAVAPDEERRRLDEVDRLLDELVAVSSRLVGVEFPGRSSVSLPLAMPIAAGLWTVRQVRRRGVTSADRAGLESMVSVVDRLAAIVESYRPARAPRRVDVCIAHQRAGADAQIDPHYRRHELCRWCGDFRRVHGVNPPPRLVRLHDRGIRMTTTILRNAGIRQGA